MSHDQEPANVPWIFLTGRCPKFFHPHYWIEVRNGGGFYPGFWEMQIIPSRPTSPSWSERLVVLQGSRDCLWSLLSISKGLSFVSFNISSLFQFNLKPVLGPSLAFEPVVRSSWFQVLVFSKYEADDWHFSWTFEIPRSVDTVRIQIRSRRGKMDSVAFFQGNVPRSCFFQLSWVFPFEGWWEILME